VSDEEDDWFTRALKESADDDGADGPDDDGDSATSDDGDFGMAGTDADDSGADADDGDFGMGDLGDDDVEAAFGGGGGFGGETEFDEGALGGDGFDDFATAFENAPGPGGGEFGGTEFDDEEFESDIPRVEVGIEGLDEMILGGVPERSLVAAIGSAGTGKTTFGLQFLSHALENDERCVYITLEETRRRILDTADEKGWAFSEYAASGDLAVVDLDPVEMANSLASISSDLPDLIEEFGASLLEMMYDRPPRRRSEVFEFSRSLKAAGVTTMVTSEASQESAYNSRYGIIEYLADAVFVLQYVRPSDFRETRLAVEIQKIRDANHSRETKPYEITDEGISVYRQANIF
jgi:KaiC domain protein